MSIHTTRRSAGSTLMALSLGVLAPLRAQAQSPVPTLPAKAAERISALQAQPELAGERVYSAKVHPLGQPDGPLLFVYARHVHPKGKHLLASHLTYLPSGELIIEERVTSSDTYGFQRFDVANRQTGLAGSVVLDAQHGQLRYEGSQDADTKSERVTEPVVAGPNLHGHILQHWDALLHGARMQVRLVVLARMETLGFTIQAVERSKEITAFQITPSHFLIRLMVSPLRVEFDNATRRVLRYEGRVPPMQKAGHKLVDLDASVDYQWATDRYR